MRMTRLVLALLPVVLSACSADGGPGDGTAGTDTTGGETSGGSTTAPPADTTGSGPTGVNPTTGGSTGVTPGTTGATGGMTGGTGSGGTGMTGMMPGGDTGGGMAGGTGGTGSGGTGGLDSTDDSTADDSSGTDTTGGATDGDGGVNGSDDSTDDTSGTGATGDDAGTTPTGPMTCPYTPPEDPDSFPQNWTAGEVTQFNDNGGWTWYNDERVVVDAEAGKIVVSSAASNANSQSSNTSIDVVIHDLATGMNDKHSLGNLSYSDDHNNGGIVVKAPGEYFVAYAHHNVDCNTYWANYSGGSWGQTVTHTWGQGCPWPEPNGGTSDITYNNVWQLSSEGRIYNFIRSVQTSPTFLHSEDNGATWTWGGRLTASPQVGYNAGYYKYWGNGVDRIDFFATEAHPRDADTSVFHGYIQGGKTYDSFGKLVDDNLFDESAPEIIEFTRVFGAGSAVGGATLHRLWNFDVARYEDGTIGVLWQGREQRDAQKPSNPVWDPGHHVAYSRFDGTEWKSTRLVKGGRTLYRRLSGDWWEEDYLGGAALDPDDPHVVYVSTNIDPRDDTTEYTWNEIWKGVSCDDGASFTWTPMTMNSQTENLRPAVPKWDTQNTALLWFRGEYNTAQEYDAEVVGILTRE